MQHVLDAEAISRNCTLTQSRTIEGSSQVPLEESVKNPSTECFFIGKNFK